MLDINSIKEKDINIQITKLDSFEDNGVYSKVIYAKLTQPLEKCPFCGMKYFTNGKPLVLRMERSLRKSIIQRTTMKRQFFF